jgi:hypothetical protein
METIDKILLGDVTEEVVDKINAGLKQSVENKIAISKLPILFEGSRAEYETAYASGAISVGSLVVITDITDEDTSGGSGDNTNPDITTAILGKAILGQMILGKGD